VSSGPVVAVWRRFSGASRRARVLWVVAAAVAAHASVLRGGFVWLDHAHLEERLALAPPSGWWRLFLEPFAGTGFYRPLTALSLSLDALVGSAAFFHATTLAWHAAAAAMVVVAGEALGFSRRVATLAGVAFAVHPLSSLVAGAIAFRSESMITFFLLALVAAHLRGRWLVAALALLAGALTKETALVLGPLFVIAIELRRRAEHGRGRLLGAEAVAWASAFGLRLAFAPAWLAHRPDLGVSQALGTRLATLAKSVAAFAVPLDPTLCDAFPISGLTAPAALFGALVVVGLGVLVLTRGLTAWLLALSILPSLQLVPTLRFWSPHYLYVPLAFATLLAADTLVARGRRAFALALAACVGLAVVSWLDGRRFRNDETLFGPEVAREPACREGQFYLGEAHRQRREWEAAAKRYEVALESRPGVLAFVDLDATLQNLGVVRMEQGDLELARRAFELALKEANGELARRKIRYDLAVVAMREDDPNRAVDLLADEVSRPDALPDSLRIYADALALVSRRGRPPDKRPRAK
jgi:hypothetical protein